MKRRAFTLIELLVVIAMIAVLTGVVGAGVSKARKNAKITRARAEAQEITNAILSYANYTEDGSLRSIAGKLNDAEASKSTLGFLIGEGQNAHGSSLPVLYNAAISKGKGAFLDPWGHPYRVTVKRGQSITPMGVPAMGIRLFYPNWHRMRD